MRRPVLPRSTLRQSAAAAALRALPVRERITQMLRDGGELREVAPRRYATPDGALHHLSARTLQAALRAGVLLRVAEGHYVLAARRPRAGAAREEPG
ncbi:hypothetical protein [Xenophilus sp. Marseille-Q4582]|uniref:hypothetical protein n=1 Tax=Xenophilus sp. Marseille-Q4582 TaxID=2866600 RepID=UPI001CE44233|nr:hypothetical protein [Xenophilus sp. Marseille-Q4582]